MKKKSIISILPILVLAFSMLIPGVLTKPPVKQSSGQFTVNIWEDIEGDGIVGDINAVGWEYRWRVHFRANYAGGHVPDQPVLFFDGESHDGNDFELTINNKRNKASLFFAWVGDKPYRLLVSGGFTLNEGVYTLSNVQAKIYDMSKGKGKLVETFTVTFHFKYSTG